MIPKKVTPVIDDEPVSPTNPMPTGSAVYTEKFAYDTNKLVEFHGWADPGSTASAGVWRIAKFTYSGDFLVTDIQYADGNANFDNVWNDRESLSYS